MEIKIVGNNIDKAEVEKVEEGEFYIREVVEILTKPDTNGKYQYAIFDVFHINLAELREVEEELGEITGWYKGFVLLGRVPYLSEINVLPDGSVEEVYHIHLYGYVGEHLVEHRKFTTWIIHDDLVY